MTTLGATARTWALTGAVSLLAGGAASAQVTTIQGNTISDTVTIEAIEQSSRTMTVRNAKGIHETVQAPAVMTRFSELKVGDKITVTYFDNVVVRLKKPGEAAVDVDTAGISRGTGPQPAGTVAAQRTITVTVTEMDPQTSSVTVKGPNGYVYSRRVTDKKAYALLKVGDQLDMTWTQASLISVAPPKEE